MGSRENAGDDFLAIRRSSPRIWRLAIGAVYSPLLIDHRAQDGQGINRIPAQSVHRGHGTGFGSNPYALISAIGTLLAAVAALVSVRV